MKFDYRSITDTIQRSLASAGLTQGSGLMRNITDTIERSLSLAGLTTGPQPTTPEPELREAPGAPAPGELVELTFSNEAGTRSYKLYVPSSRAQEDATLAPLVIMLHGCKQAPDDFARGTRMNELAERHGFLVAYPAQPVAANGSSCWNWFRPEDQVRDRGEPSIVAGIAAEITARHRVDPRRVFVAGMSAGGAMAVVLATTYPDRFAAIGVHSGLPYGAAHDVPSAFGAMKNGRGARSSAALAVPAIVFHGDSDQTVNVRNGTAIVEQAIASHAGLRGAVTEGSSADGRAFRRTVHSNAAGHPVAEQWLLSGAGHAWSGGDARGSFTDSRGPDASAEMIRYFLSVPAAESA